jgi:hypothetical protein
MMHVSKVNYFSLRNTNTISYHCTLNNTVLDWNKDIHSNPSDQMQQTIILKHQQHSHK